MDCSGPVVDDTIIEDTADVAGGGIFCALGSSTPIELNAVAGNTAGENGGGVYCLRSSPATEANTITGNTAGECAGGIFCEDESSPTVINLVLWGDSGDSGPEIYLAASCSLTVSYSDVEGGSAAVYVGPGGMLQWDEGNIDADPRFVKSEWRDYRLLWGSPCIDSGHPDSLDPGGTRSDMGAFFFDQSKSLVTYVTPETLSLLLGDSLHVLYTLVNCNDEPQPCRGIVKLTLPDGEPWPGNPLEGPGYGIIHRHYSWQYVREYQVRDMCPLGTWELAWKVGMPGNVFDQDGFKFTVVEP
ncbi:hypothetical protein AMJ39_05310 [candidate division TA06 bacterium DG_24]|uniref:Right handed beta helix domain-containing protein n=3 Tax=Bacteria division TA06 TaxID=1156500 RepID=A0A0S8JK16_UNCT6|nr:MAG: hypothetical protein AMJ39_05310 [candidate division TA06 bacterium DG_24]KPK69767.1 MAG: hypothetical protein AMJ82_04830 [candidate division TA06 bacterium SM23_40]KPL10137.1 MAG: hypothetical protein AMJ71_04245 [candidate division TA06 bacterium SM1_40]